MIMRNWILLALLILTLTASGALAAPLVDPKNAELEALRQNGRNVLVIEYYDAENRRIDTKSSISDVKPTPVGLGAGFRFGEGPTINLWGLSPCDHDRRLVDAKYDGTCRGFITEGLTAILKSGPVLLCRAFVDQQDAAVKSASCFVLVSYSSVYGVTKLEEFLISGGYARLTRDEKGKALRPDLEEDERIARGFGRGLWSFEHEKVRGQKAP